MADQSDLERTEPASQRRLEQAREEGQVPQSRELSAFLVLVAGAGGIWLLGTWLAGRVGTLVRHGLTLDHRSAFDSHVMGARLAGSGSASVMGAYLTLKEVIQGRLAPRIGLLVNRAMDALQAASISSNMHGLVGTQVGRELEHYGWLPQITAWGDTEGELSAGGGACLEAILGALLPPDLRHGRCLENDERNQSKFQVGSRARSPALAAHAAAGNMTSE